jgi:hypothetical protein
MKKIAERSDYIRFEDNNDIIEVMPATWKTVVTEKDSGDVFENEFETKKEAIKDMNQEIEALDKENGTKSASLKQANNIQSAFDHELKPRFKIKLEKTFEELENFLLDVHDLKIKPESLNYSIMRYCGNESQKDFAEKLVSHAYDWLENLKKSL